MDQDGNPIPCMGCRTTNGVRVFRATHILVPMCDRCAVMLPVIDGRGRELRVRAVATERFPAAHAA